jgi:hypothetical protein
MIGIRPVARGPVSARRRQELARATSSSLRLAAGWVLEVKTLAGGTDLVMSPQGLTEANRGLVSSRYGW